MRATLLATGLLTPLLVMLLITFGNTWGLSPRALCWSAAALAICGCTCAFNA